MALKTRYHAVVLGAGMAGFCAASELHRAERSVLTLDLGASASSLWSGAWNLARPESSPPSEGAKTCANFVSRLLQPFLEMEFEWGSLQSLPGSDGRYYPAWGCQRIQGGIRAAKFSARDQVILAGNNWRFLTKDVARALGIRAEIFLSTSRNTPPVGDRALATIAAELDDQREAFHQLASEIEIVARDAAFVWLPPVFRSVETWAALERIAPGRLGELINRQEPVAGHRLTRAMRESLAKQGIDQKTVEKVGYTSAQGKVRTVRFLPVGEKQWTEIEADVFLLATGRFLGGGCERTLDAFRERVFGLPLKGEEGALTLDESARPSDGTKPFFSNLYAAGCIATTVAAPIDTIGRVALSGMEAAQQALQGGQ